jgi:hypothetical protein
VRGRGGSVYRGGDQPDVLINGFAVCGTGITVGAMLPVVKSWDSMPGEAVLRADAARLGGELGMDVASLTRFEEGSRPVYASGDLVLKLFPQADGAAYRVEASPAR